MTSQIRSKSLANSQRVSLLDALPGLSKDGVETVKSMLSYKGSPDWPGIKAVPPGAFIEELVELFRRQTDIPLELPLIAALTHVSGFLNAVGARYELSGRLYPAKIWTVVLAPSSSGKTFTTNTVSRWLTNTDSKSVAPQLPGASSAAKFMSNLVDVPCGAWVRDEFGQFLSQIQSQAHMEEMKDILLRMYSQDDLERRTKERDIVIRGDDHAMSILGVTVEDTFESQIGADSLVDGFAQRFNYLRAPADPHRLLTDFPIYFENLHEPEFQAAFQRMRAGWLSLLGRNDLPGAIFTFDDEAISLFKRSFRAFFDESGVPPSFYRRVMFSAFSYAVLYHVVAGKPGTSIGGDSISLAARMIAIHLDHAKALLSGYGLSDLEKTIRKAEALRDRRAAQGAKLKPRDLISSIREIKTAAQAQAILGLI